MGKIVKLNSFIAERVWGGEKLKKLKNLNSINPVGETWEVSTLREGASKLDSLDLSEVCELSYLVKFIDTSQNLSIQVHPDEEYAREHEGGMGKTECWLILEAEESACIYLGLKKDVTKKEFFNAVDAGLPVDKYLNCIEVKQGDFYYIPAGTIHAIGGGITLVEVQQSSGITYRVWDWNRISGINGKRRELHIDKAKDVIDFSDSFNEKVLDASKRNLLEQVGISTIIEHEDFSVQLFSNMSQKNLEIQLKEKDSLVLLSGKILGDVVLSAFESAIVLEKGLFKFKLERNTSFLIVSE